MAERDGEIIAGGYDQVADEYGLPGIDPRSGPPPACVVPAAPATSRSGAERVWPRRRHRQATDRALHQRRSPRAAPARGAARERGGPEAGGLHVLLLCLPATGAPARRWVLRRRRSRSGGRPGTRRGRHSDLLGGSNPLDVCVVDVRDRSSGLGWEGLGAGRRSPPGLGDSSTAGARSLPVRVRRSRCGHYNFEDVRRDRARAPAHANGK